HLRNRCFSRVRLLGFYNPRVLLIAVIPLTAAPIAARHSQVPAHYRRGGGAHCFPGHSLGSVWSSSAAGSSCVAQARIA
ncbi:hypothetical protein, partial [Pseudomonas aeruginosa]|uniref:hypothetical protein n=1 Tax=Pseudomonas aeruginosa TaxID=287 RepID=UPI001ED9B3FA